MIFVYRDAIIHWVAMFSSFLNMSFGRPQAMIPYLDYSQWHQAIMWPDKIEVMSPYIACLGPTHF